MGYMRHHAIAVTGYDEEIVQQAYRQAVAFGLQPTEPVKAPVNSYWTLFVPPDGSKEGWDESEAGDYRRGQFIAWLGGQRFEDGSSPLAWVEVQYGDDERETKVTAHSDEPERWKGADDS